ncbi:MAG: response regulator [Gammaproteobacteria bacterium]|nr:response regulator [Gammaproteobacteria bacterium]
MSNSKILVADDDTIMLAILAKGLRSAGYCVVTATNGEEALEVARSMKPDLAVLDIRMPGVFGIEVARRLRESPGIDSIFLSAYADKEVVELATKEGALGYLVKPVNSKQLIPAIEAALERSADLRRLQEKEILLTDSIKSNREISVAIGMYMEKFNSREQNAFYALRNYARSNSQKLVDLARQLAQGGKGREELLLSIYRERKLYTSRRQP